MSAITNLLHSLACSPTSTAGLKLGAEVSSLGSTGVEMVSVEVEGIGADRGGEQSTGD